MGPHQTSDYDVIVVGAGMAGLSAAALLACRGAKVLVVEQHKVVGGNCTSWRRRIPRDGNFGEYVFDCGVQDISGLGPKGPLRNLLQQLGMADEITWKRVQHLYCRNGVRIEAGTKHHTFVQGLCQQYPSDADGIVQFFTEMHAIYRELYADTDTTGGVPAPPTSGDLRDWPGTHPHAYRWLKQPFREMLRTYIADPDLHGILRAISEYITEESQRPLVQDMAPLYGYYFDGGHYPSGGSQRLPDAIARAIERHSGTIMLGTRVEKIALDHGRVTGVHLSNGDEIRAPIVLANGDVVATLTNQIGLTLLPQRYANRVAHLKRGPSALVVSVGLSTVMPLPARIFIQHEDLAFGIGNPSILDGTLAPDDHSAVTILLLLSETEATCWMDKTAPDFAARKEGVAERLFSAIEASVFPGFRTYIVHKEMSTPATFSAFTGATNGNIYGAACATWRPSVQCPIPGLFLVGAGTETGPGIEAVVISGTRAADLITRTRL